MAEPEKNRVRAAKLRGKKRITDAELKWLTAYETRVSIGKAKEGGTLPDAPSRSEPAQRDVRPAPLALVEPAQPAAVVVHETKPIEGNVSPDEATWAPVVPTATEGTPDEPPPPGAPPPPAAGTPLVDAVSDAPPQGQGDPAAAAQFAGLVVLVTGIGIASGLELFGDLDALPPFLAQLVTDEANHRRVLEQVGAAASRMAIKHNFRSVPLADEAIVGGALAGSIAAFVAVQRRKMKGGARKRSEPGNVAPPAPRDVDNVAESQIGAWPDAVASAFREAK